MFMNKTSSRADRPCAHDRGFTLVELLVVVAIIGILAGILLSALTKSKARAQGVFCLNNTRQLTIAWMVYADDHNGRLAYNLGIGGPPTKLSSSPPMSLNWANNVLDWETSNSDNTNANKLLQSGIGPYAGQSASVYRCPSDYVLSPQQHSVGWNARVRSYSMNAMIGDAGAFTQNGFNLNAPEYVQFFNAASIPRPFNIFVFLDEHPDSINDGYFMNKADENNPEWNDLPASYHDGAGCFSFADGHGEIHRWHNPSTRPSSLPGAANLPIQIPAGERADYYWVISRMSIERYSGPPATTPPPPIAY